MGVCAVEVDAILVVLLVTGFLLGYVRGALRQLIVLGAWLVAFLIAPYLRPPVGDFILANTHEYTREYVDMLAFLTSFVVMFLLALVVIELGGKTIHLSKRPVVDEVLGGFLMLGATLLSIAAVVIALDSYYLNPVVGAAEQPFIHDIQNGLARSAIVDSMHNALIPALIALLGPLLPADIRNLYVHPAL
jgi:uncharacterized membrane protein required for colicin V production